MDHALFKLPAALADAPDAVKAAYFDGVRDGLRAGFGTPPLVKIDMNAQLVTAESSAQKAFAALPEMSRSLKLARFASAINDMVTFCHQEATTRGWWTDLETGKPIELTPEVILAQMAMIHSEIGEATDAYRNDAADEHLPHIAGVTVEFADTLIRIFNLFGALWTRGKLARVPGKTPISLGSAFGEKVQYNAVRADHSPEARKAAAGKKV